MEFPQSTSFIRTAKMKLINILLATSFACKENSQVDHAGKFLPGRGLDGLISGPIIPGKPSANDQYDAFVAEVEEIIKEGMMMIRRGARVDRKAPYIRDKLIKTAEKYYDFNATNLKCIDYKDWCPNWKSVQRRSSVFDKISEITNNFNRCPVECPKTCRRCR